MGEQEGADLAPESCDSRIAHDRPSPFADFVSRLMVCEVHVMQRVRGERIAQLDAPFRVTRPLL